MALAVSRTRVLVVDDSVFARKIVSDVLASSPAIDVVGTAVNGTDALAQIPKLKPDVVTLDVEMPGINGLETLKRIMAECPTSVVMVSSLTVSGARESIQALSFGAVDVMSKPHGSQAMGMTQSMRDELIGKVLAAAGARLDNLRPAPASIVRSKLPRVQSVVSGFPVVAIASSTGGPRALRAIVPLLPTDGGVAYVVVQHLPEGFSAPMVRDLDTVTELNVRESSDSYSLMSGDLIFARAGLHTIFEHGGRTRLSADPPLWGVRPSADVTMASLVPVYGPRLIGVVLTGMGRDGANGIRLIKQAGGLTIAEHESSCVIYGMPKSAVETGAVDTIAPLDQVATAIHQAITQVVTSPRRRSAA